MKYCVYFNTPDTPVTTVLNYLKDVYSRDKLSYKWQDTNWVLYYEGNLSKLYNLKYCGAKDLIILEIDDDNVVINNILKEIQANYNNKDILKKIVASAVLAGAFDSSLSREAMKILQTGV